MDFITRKCRIGLPALAFLLGVGFAGSGASGGPIDGTRDIQGTWQQVSATRGGRLLNPDAYRLEIQGDAYTASWEKVMKSSLSLDDSGDVIAVDRTFEGVGFGPPERGVLDLEGRRLRICFDASGRGRPAKVESTPGTKTLLLTFERHRGEIPATGPIGKRLDGDWTLVETVANGIKRTMPPGMKITMSIVDGRATETTVTAISGTIEVHTGSNKIDFLPSSKRNGQKAIIDYDPKGEKLKICEASIGSDYPTGFEAKSGTSCTLRVFEKDAAKTP